MIPSSTTYPGRFLFPSGRTSAPWQRWLNAVAIGVEQPLTSERAFTVDGTVKGQFSYGPLYRSFDPIAQAAAGGGTIVTGDPAVIAGLVKRPGVAEVVVPA